MIIENLEELDLDNYCDVQEYKDEEWGNYTDQTVVGAVDHVPIAITVSAAGVGDRSGEVIETILALIKEAINY